MKTKHLPGALLSFLYTIIFFSCGNNNEEKIYPLSFEKEYYEQHPEKSLPTVIDCTDKLVMPGLVDGHNHLCNTLMNISRAFPFDYSHISDHMLTTIHDPYGWLTPESLYDITMTSAINALKHGTTTVENSTILPDTAYEAMDTSGIRGILAPQMASSFRLDSDPLNWKQALEKTKSCIEHYHNPKRRMSVAVHIHDLWDCMEKLMDGALELVRRLDGGDELALLEHCVALEKWDREQPWNGLTRCGGTTAAPSPTT